MALQASARGLALSVLLIAPFAISPAKAFDEGRGSTVDTVLGLLGLGAEKEDPNIQYRERAPLVLPPRTDLRPPRQGAAQRAPNFPQDQETVAARRKQAERGKVRLEKVEEGVQVAGARELSRNAFAPSNGPRRCDMDTDPTNPNACTAEVFWNSLKVKSEEKPNSLQAGVEPDRKYLTQPPKGYMAPIQNVKATFEAPRQKIDEPAYMYHIEQARRRSQD